MNILNHFLVPFTLLLFVFSGEVSLWEIALFTLIFGVLIDVDQLVGKYLLHKSERHHRTWLQEPLAMLLVALPLGLLLSLLKPQYLMLVLIPYALHVLLDYLAFHEVSPLAPFSKKKIYVGLFRAYPHDPWYGRREKKKGISEVWVTVAFVLILLTWFLLF